MSNARVVSIERITPEPETIALVAVPPCTLASMTIRDNDLVRFVREDAAPSTMTIVLADARACVTIAPPPTARSLANVAIAIVAFDSLESFEEDFVSSAFDAVLPVAIGAETTAEPALADALTALAAFATATIISLPVDEACRFFLGAGRLTLGRGDDLDIASATRRAVRQALEAGGRRRDGRLFIHLEVGADTLMEDLRLANAALAGAPPFADRYLAVSESRDLRRRATVILASRRGAAAKG